jgi:glycine/D-amino acid oxidase-like deaminating enzyme
MPKDFLIVGQGLAGSFLAWHLLKRGQTVVIVDDAHADCSSFAAAGMINPITGKRLVLSPRCERLLPFAKSAYRELEQQFHQTFFEPKDIIRLFRDDKERKAWERKRAVTHLKEYYGDRMPPGSYGKAINDALGSFLIRQGGYCRTGELMQCFTDFFRSRDCLVNARFRHEELELDEGRVSWRGQNFDRVIFSEGYQAKDNPFFSWLPYNLAKGEILTLGLDEPLLPDTVISCGKWCIPLAPGQYTVGSTYGWDRFDCRVTGQAQDEILSAISHFLRVPFRVLDHAAGVRPIVKDLKPAMGLHPRHRQVAIFNGLASKGLLWGPFYARQMTRFLLDDEPLEAEVSIDRFNK